MKITLGIDDSDSSKGMCTTYLGYRLVRRLADEGCRFDDYPSLVRLNPNIPFKTRGNAAVSLSFLSPDFESSLGTVISTVKELSDVPNGANTGLVVVKDRSLVSAFRAVYERAISGVVNKASLKPLLSSEGIHAFSLGNGMGLVGASASIGFNESYDHTYELIAYRRKENWGKPRAIDKDGVKAMDQQTHPHTFNNFDYEKEKAMVSPHGPDPVLLGIRGETPDWVLRAFHMLKINEEIDGYLIYRTNQCTSAHLQSNLTLPPKAYYSGLVSGSVATVTRGPGGHVYLAVEVGGNDLIAAVYEPTGDLRRVAGRLAPGDSIILGGGVRKSTSKHPAALNVELLRVLKLAAVLARRNPRCPNCNRIMKSEGRGKGFQCRKCGAKLRQTKKTVSRMKRNIVLGHYVPSTRAHRHLTKPLVRYGAESAGTIHPLVPGWLGSSQIIPLKAPARSPQSGRPSLRFQRKP